MQKQNHCILQKHKLEKPSVFEEIGFKVNIDKDDFKYMYYGEPEQVRMKLLAHTAMTNLWKSTSGLWLANKRAWNAKLEEAGERKELQKGQNSNEKKFKADRKIWEKAAGNRTKLDG